MLVYERIYFQSSEWPRKDNHYLSRKFSSKKLFFDNQKTSSPTYLQSTQERSLMEQALDPANAAERAVLSSSHLAAMNGGSQPSTSPGYPSPNQPSPTSPPTLGGSTLASRSYRSDQPTPARSTFQQENDQYQASTYSRDSQKPAPSRRAQTPALDTPSSNGSVEIFKSFRVSMEDPCYKVLPLRRQGTMFRNGREASHIVQAIGQGRKEAHVHAPEN